MFDRVCFRLFVFVLFNHFGCLIVYKVIPCKSTIHVPFNELGRVRQREKSLSGHREVSPRDVIKRGGGCAGREKIVVVRAKGTSVD